MMIQMDETDVYSDQIESDVEAELYGMIHHDSKTYEDNNQDNNVSLNHYGLEQSSKSKMDASRYVANSSSDPSDLLDETISDSKVAYINSLNQPKDVSMKVSENGRLRGCVDLMIGKANQLLKEETIFCIDSVIKPHSQSTPACTSSMRLNIKNYASFDDDSDVILLSSDEEEEEKTKLDKREDNEDCEIIESPKPRLKLGNVTNLLNKTLEEMKKFYDEDDYDSDREESVKRNMNNDRSLWQVNYKDFNLSGSSRSSQKRRYYPNSIECKNCREKGHMSKYCPQPKKVVCYLCGQSGHSGQNCRLILCSKCHKFTHRTNQCNADLSHTYCNECDGYGHQQHDCPNHWRKYHMTTNANDNPGSPIQVESTENKRKSCFNCARNHFGFNCKQKFITRDLYPQSSLFGQSQSKHNHSSPRKSRQSNSYLYDGHEASTSTHVSYTYTPSSFISFNGDSITIESSSDDDLESHQNKRFSYTPNSSRSKSRTNKPIGRKKNNDKKSFATKRMKQHVNVMINETNNPQMSSNKKPYKKKKTKYSTKFRKSPETSWNRKHGNRLGNSRYNSHEATSSTPSFSGIQSKKRKKSNNKMKNKYRTKAKNDIKLKKKGIKQETHIKIKHVKQEY